MLLYVPERADIGDHKSNPILIFRLNYAQVLVTIFKLDAAARTVVADLNDLIFKRINGIEKKPS